MTDTYMVGDGHDVAQVDLDVINPQPRSTGIQFTRWSVSPAGTVSKQGKYIIFEFTALEDAEMYQDVLEQFGVLDEEENDVTVYVRDDTWTWVRQNGTAIRPEMGRDARWDDYFPRRIGVLVRDLEDVA